MKNGGGMISVWLGSFPTFTYTELYHSTSRSRNFERIAFKIVLLFLPNTERIPVHIDEIDGRSIGDFVIDIFRFLSIDKFQEYVVCGKAFELYSCDENILKRTVLKRIILAKRYENLYDEHLCDSCKELYF